MERGEGRGLFVRVVLIPFCSHRKVDLSPRRSREGPGGDERRSTQRLVVVPTVSYYKLDLLLRQEDLESRRSQGPSSDGFKSKQRLCWQFRPFHLTRVFNNAGTLRSSFQLSHPTRVFNEREHKQVHSEVCSLRRQIDGDSGIKVSPALISRLSQCMYPEQCFP